MISCKLGDITTIQTDAIVNAAKPSLLGGSGVDGAIHRAAGPSLVEECQKIREIEPQVRCPTGQSRITTGHNLPCKWIIHTVGPVWDAENGYECDQLLNRAYHSSFAAARMLGIRTIALPAISCGIYRYPVDRAATIALSVARLWEPFFDEITFLFIQEDVKTSFEQALASLDS